MATSKKLQKKLIETKKFKVTQENFLPFREDFMTQRVFNYYLLKLLNFISTNLINKIISCFK